MNYNLNLVSDLNINLIRIINHLIVFIILIALTVGCTKRHVSSKMAFEVVSSENRGVEIIDRYDDVDGFYIFYNKRIISNKPRQLIYFVHGLGALNPAIYGKWIKYLTEQHTVVVFPRYQMGTMNPLPSKFSETVPAAFHRSWDYLSDSLQLSIDFSDFHFIGHSYGGAAIGFLVSNLEFYDIPKPKTIMLCHPGTGPFSALVQDDYSAIPSDVKVVVISAEKDVVVGDKMSKLIFNTANQVSDRVWIRHFEDGEGEGRLRADHRSPYAVDTLFDNQIMNGTARRAWSKGRYDEEDIAGFFKIGDALRNMNSNKTWLFNPDQKEWPLGFRSDGKIIRPFELVHPTDSIH